MTRANPTVTIHSIENNFLMWSIQVKFMSEEQEDVEEYFCKKERKNKKKEEGKEVGNRCWLKRDWNQGIW